MSERLSLYLVHHRGVGRSGVERSETQRKATPRCRAIPAAARRERCGRLVVQAAERPLVPVEPRLVVFLAQSHTIDAAARPRTSIAESGSWVIASGLLQALIESPPHARLPAAGQGTQSRGMEVGRATRRGDWASRAIP